MFFKEYKFLYYKFIKYLVKQIKKIIKVYYQDIQSIRIKEEVLKVFKEENNIEKIRNQNVID